MSTQRGLGWLVLPRVACMAGDGTAGRRSVLWAGLAAIAASVVAAPGLV